MECRYHFTCVDITEPQAEEISELSVQVCKLYCVTDLSTSDIYICPTCVQMTGRRSASELNKLPFFLPSFFYYVATPKKARFFFPPLLCSLDFFLTLDILVLRNGFQNYPLCASVLCTR